MIAPGEAHNPDQSLADARAGSPEALGNALEAHRRYLLLVAEKELAPDLRHKGGASDLVQETFIEAQRDFEQFRGESGNEFRGWLRRILLHNLGAFTRRYRDCAMRDVGREVGLFGEGSQGGPADGMAAGSATPSGVAMAQEQSLALRGRLIGWPTTTAVSFACATTTTSRSNRSDWRWAVRPRRRENSGHGRWIVFARSGRAPDHERRGERPAG